MVGPIVWDRRGRKLSPMHVAPWATDTGTKVSPPILRALRGDFFCLPFGGNATPVRGKKIPPHGETANGNWTLKGATPDSVTLSMKLGFPKGEITKTVWVNPGEPCVYQRHVLSGFSGKVNFGHHAMLAFRPEYGVGRITTSPFVRGQVFPGVFEDPAQGGYSALRAGSNFSSLDQVLLASGQMADLSRYPAREGFEDLVMISSPPTETLGWSAVTFPQAGFVWIGFKNPATLASTILWHSNGGRHYAPWSSRHRRVLGIEEVTGNFHHGLAESTADNEIAQSGIATHLTLAPRKPLSVGYIMACVPIPAGFDEVADVHEAAGGVVLTPRNGPNVGLRVDLSMLQTP